MRALWPYLALYKRHKWLLLLGIVLAIVTLLASIGLLTLSGWFLSASAVVGVAGIYSFNYMLPAAGVRGAAIIRTAGRYFERLVSHDATFRVLQHLRVFTFSKLLPLSRRAGAFSSGRAAQPGGCRCRYPGSSLSARYIAAGRGAGGDPGRHRGAERTGRHAGPDPRRYYAAHPAGDAPLFYRAGKPAGESMTRLRGQLSPALTSWLQGQAELMLFNASDRYRRQMEKTEAHWLDAQRRQAELTALSQALMLLIGGIAVIAMLWLASAGVGGDTQPGALIALFVFCALAAFEALAPVTGAFQHLGQVIASAKRITQITEQEPEVSFTQGEEHKLESVSLNLNQVTFSYPQQPSPALENFIAGQGRGAYRHPRTNRLR
jgi:ATP-binding cassette subfamily C protein CydC